MQRIESQAWQAALYKWFQSTPGRLLVEAEQNELCRVLPKMFGYYALQIGSYWPDQAMQTCLISCKVVLDAVPVSEKPIGISALPSELPIRSDSVDLMVLPHVLEFEKDPHQILREADRVLIPEGHIIIFGFNPLSMWGAWRMLAGLRKRVPWTGQFLTQTRLKDWLALLGFEVKDRSVFFQRPPIWNEATMNRLSIMETSLQNWFSSLGAVYMLVAQKKEIRLTPVKPKWRQRPRLVPAPPVAEGLEHGSR